MPIALAPLFQDATIDIGESGAGAIRSIEGSDLTRRFGSDRTSAGQFFSGDPPHRS
jgi:hypothetical protein